MSEKQNCVFLLLRQSLTFRETYPEYVESFTDAREVTAAARELNDHEKFYTENGHQKRNEFRYSVKTVWL